MAAVVRVPLVDITNLPSIAREPRCPKRAYPSTPLDKENIDPLSPEGRVLFGLTMCHRCRALTPSTSMHLCEQTHHVARPAPAKKLNPRAL